MKLICLKLLWHQFNEDYFEGKLWCIPILKWRNKRYWGEFQVSSIPKIRLSKVRNKDKGDWIDSLLHEMIHQYIWQMDIEDDDDHGKEFNKIAERIRVQIDNEFT